MVFGINEETLATGCRVTGEGMAVRGPVDLVVVCITVAVGVLVDVRGLEVMVVVDVCIVIFLIAVGNF